MQGSGIAINPRTGKEIKILQTETSIHKDKKVLEWKEGRGLWDTISTNPVSDLWLALDEDALDSFVEKTRKVKLVFVKKEILKTIGVEKLKEYRVQNLICLEEMKDLFPYLGAGWDGTIQDAVVLAAGLLRYHRIAGGVFTPKGILMGSQRASQLGIQEERSNPPELWWVTQYYVPEKAKRRREISTCLQKNLESKLISKVVLLNEKKESIPANEKIEERVIGHRLTYKDVFEAASTFPGNVLVAFANADICIDDETWKTVWQIDMKDKMLALLRYDVGADGKATLFGPRADSQDCWITSSESIRTRIASIGSLDIPFGKAGCDNAVALEFLRQRFLVSNPCLTLRTFHYHDSQIRSYDARDIVDRPAYLYITPTGIHDLLPLTKSLKLEKGGFFKATNCFVTETGLVFDKEKMYIGPSDEAQKIWGQTGVHAITPCMEVQKGLIVPFHEEDMKVREKYIVNILAKILRLREEIGNGEFVCPETFSSILNIFDWKTESLPVLRYEKNVHLWCKEALAYPITQVGLEGEDIEALRSAMRGYMAEPKEEKTIVIVEGGEVVADELEESLEGLGFTVKVVYAGRSSVERLWDILRGAWGVICSKEIESWGWNWMLPRRAYVYGYGDGAKGMANACGHYYRQCSSAKTVLEEIQRDAGLYKESGLPVIWMPRTMGGYFHHAGDSFREMARLWAKRGYVEVREHPTAVQVWWGSVGDVLLYDRPTHEWRLSAPMEEREYRIGLFGNPKPPIGGGNSWFFWPRRPELVEELAEQQKGWEERREGVVFYGKTENRVQAKRRQTCDWQAACLPGEWFMASSVDEPYPFTQKEYLEKLSQARFGLCLAGYGLKCHREVECMAMGCVPLVAPECDMEFYAEPPVEGVHYIRVKSPEEAKQVAASISKEEWEGMSVAAYAWWKRNCSCEGSFALTKRLIEAS